MNDVTPLLKIFYIIVCYVDFIFMLFIYGYVKIVRVFFNLFWFTKGPIYYCDIYF